MKQLTKGIYDAIAKDNYNDETTGTSAVLWKKGEIYGAYVNEDGEMCLCSEDHPLYYCSDAISHLMDLFDFKELEHSETLSLMTGWAAQLDNTTIQNVASYLNGVPLKEKGLVVAVALNAGDEWVIDLYGALSDDAPIRLNGNKVAIVNINRHGIVCSCNNEDEDPTECRYYKDALRRSVPITITDGGINRGLMLDTPIPHKSFTLYDEDDGCTDFGEGMYPHCQGIIFSVADLDYDENYKEAVADLIRQAQSLVAGHIFASDNLRTADNGLNIIREMDGIISAVKYW